MSRENPQSELEVASRFLVEEVFRNVPDKITAGEVLARVLPLVMALLTGEWTAERRLAVQVEVHKVLRAMKIIPEV